MKKLFLTLGILTAVMMAFVAVSCDRDNGASRSLKIVDEVDIEEFRSMAREAFEQGRDVDLSYDSINSRVIMHTTAPQQAGGSEFGEAVSENIVALVAVVLALVMPGVVTVLVFFFIFRYLRQRRVDRYKVIEHSLDRGVQLPDSFYMAESVKHTNTPRSAIVWIGWGLAITIFFWSSDMGPLAAFGLIPLFVGIARGVTYLVGRHDARQKEKEDDFGSDPLF